MISKTNECLAIHSSEVTQWDHFSFSATHWFISYCLSLSLFSLEWQGTLAKSANCLMKLSTVNQATEWQRAAHAGQAASDEGETRRERRVRKMNEKEMTTRRGSEDWRKVCAICTWVTCTRGCEMLQREREAGVEASGERGRGRGRERRRHTEGDRFYNQANAGRWISKEWGRRTLAWWGCGWM